MKRQADAVLEARVVSDGGGHVEYVIGGEVLAVNHRVKRGAECVGRVQDAFGLTGCAGGELKCCHIIRARTQPIEHRASSRVLGARRE